MQRLVRKLVTNHYEHHHHSYRIFGTLSRSSFSLPKPTRLRHHISTSASFLTPPLHRCHSCHTLSARIGGLIVHQFVSNSRNALFRSRPKLPGALLYGQSSGFNQSSYFYQRTWRSWFRKLTVNDMVLGLIIANAAVFLLWRIADEKFMINNFTISLDNLKSGRLHTLITNAFSHIQTEHLISNMIGLYFFGINVARNFGPEFLLKLYLAGAVGGSVFYLVHQAYKAQKSKQGSYMYRSKELALGASGAVNAVMMFDIFLFPKSTIFFDFFIPVPAILLGIFLIGKDTLRIIEGDSNISGAAHLGGAAVAALAVSGFRKGRFH